MNITLWTFAAAAAIVLAWALFDRHLLIKRFDKRKKAERALKERVRERQLKEASLERAVEVRATDKAPHEVSGRDWISSVLRTIEEMNEEERLAAYTAHIKEPKFSHSLRASRESTTGRFIVLSRMDIARALVERTAGKAEVFPLVKR